MTGPLAFVQAEEPAEMRLWEGMAPGALGDESKDVPTLIAYPLTLNPSPDRPADDAVAPNAPPSPSAALLICPGGGYGGLAIGHEGHEIAAWANQQGLTAFILNYRHRGKGYGHPAPLQDVQRAMRMIRSQAEQWRIDPQRVGVIGFSAGGHLASTLATHHDAGTPEHPDAVERQSCRPDFAVLCYPVIAFDEPFTHRGSQRNLLGDNPSTELLQSLSNEKQVTSLCPPVFLLHTSEDQAVDPQNSLAFYASCLRAGVPAELHIYRQGRHGVGLAATISGTNQWPDACARWLRGLGMLQVVVDMP